MKSRSPLYATLVALGWAAALLIAPACQTISSTSKPETTEPKRILAGEGATAATECKLRIATFNIANLSVGKLTNDNVASTLVALVRKFDVIAVQELDDASLKAPDAFLAKINAAAGERYQMVASAEGGSTASTGQKEQYGVYFNSAKVEALDSGMLYPDKDDEFVREPFAVQLRPKCAATSFVILTIHTAPEKAPQEIAALRRAADWAANRYTGESGVIILGDYNAGKRYVPLAKIAAIRARYLPYLWVVNDDADTTLGAEPQAHDRIVVTGTLADRFNKVWGVDRSFTDKKVSDHFPVWAEFSFGGPN